jgi:hypothetical protein
MNSFGGTFSTNMHHSSSTSTKKCNPGVGEYSRHSREIHVSVDEDEPGKILTAFLDVDESAVPSIFLPHDFSRPSGEEQDVSSFSIPSHRSLPRLKPRRSRPLPLYQSLASFSNNDDGEPLTFTAVPEPELDTAPTSQSTTLPTSHVLKAETQVIRTPPSVHSDEPQQFPSATPQELLTPPSGKKNLWRPRAVRRVALFLD